MKLQKIKYSIIIYILCFGFFHLSCDRRPELPETPVIEFQSLKKYTYLEKGNFAQPELEDSLVINLKFQDGDGDLGLRRTEIYPPYNEFNYIYSDDGKTKQKIQSPNDFVNCYDYSVEPPDTFKVNRNPRHFNFFVEYWVKQKDGTFKKFDYDREICTLSNDVFGGTANNYISPHGRFPFLTPDNYSGPIEGTLTYYTIIDPLTIREIFEGKFIKLRIYIMDRAGHSSNTIETPEIYITPFNQ